MLEKSLLKDEPQKLIKSYQDLLEKNGIPVKQIILFGSYAKGKNKPWSDLDLCIVSEIFGKDSYDEMVRLKQLAVKIEPLIEPHPYNSSDLNDVFDPLAFEIKASGKRVA